ncbi:uncharacterized protein LOC108024430 [Drosophila biarmipes]|uniref:uncharacterized protein LOC108024430 n=1 Tax=Drosophila biarmipes TaxID=125945 RepID=UPI0007E77734|nr:uncharacterized protein LOC108024430 [Drosophila biarmipes]
MHNLRDLVITLSLFLSLGNAQSYCQLDANYIWTNQIFAQRVSNHYELLPADWFLTNQRISLLCGGNTPVFDSTCQANGQFNPPLPKSNCSVEVPPSVQVVNGDSSCPYTMYKVGFVFGTTFLEIYRSCYDAKTMTAAFSIHKVYPTSLDSYRRHSWDRDGLISPADEALFTKESIYERFKSIFGNKQTYIRSKTSDAFDRGHLTPSADYTFYKISGQTNKYLNAIAQSSSINRGRWQKVEKWVRDLSRSNNEVLRVCTGGLGILKLKNSKQNPTPIYLGPGKLPVPEWTYKIITISTGQKVVILMTNNGFENKSLNPSSICTIVNCPVGINTAGNTFCCDPSDFIRRNVPNLSRSC